MWCEVYFFRRIIFFLSFSWKSDLFFEIEVGLRDHGCLVRGRKASDIPPAAALE